MIYLPSPLKTKHKACFQSTRFSDDQSHQSSILKALLSMDLSCEADNQAFPSIMRMCGSLAPLFGMIGFLVKKNDLKN